MPTLRAGENVSVFCPTDGLMTITPGAAGRVSLNARGRDGGQAIAPREIYSETVIAFSAGDTIILEAINTDATYTSPVSGGGEVTAASVQAALSSDPAGGRTALGLGSAATQPSTAFAPATEVATFAALPAANTVTPGRVYTVLGNITGSAGGAFGSQWVSNGTVWRPAGRQALWALTAQADGVSGGSASEQILASVLLPPRALAGCRSIVLHSRWTTSGSDANARTLRWRIGANGTTADAVAYAWAAFGATQRVANFPFHASPDGTTGLLPHAAFLTTTNGSPDVQASGSGAPLAAVSVPDMLTTALYVSASVEQGASPTQQISLARAWIYVE